MLVALSI